MLLHRLGSKVVRVHRLAETFACGRVGKGIDGKGGWWGAMLEEESMFVVVLSFLGHFDLCSQRAYLLSYLEVK